MKTSALLNTCIYIVLSECVGDLSKNRLQTPSLTTIEYLIKKKLQEEQDTQVSTTFTSQKAKTVVHDGRMFVI